MRVGGCEWQARKPKVEQTARLSLSPQPSFALTLLHLPTGGINLSPSLKDRKRIVAARSRIQPKKAIFTSNRKGTEQLINRQHPTDCSLVSVVYAVVPVAVAVDVIDADADAQETVAGVGCRRQVTRAKNEVRLPEKSIGLGAKWNPSAQMARRLVGL